MKDFVVPRPGFDRLLKWFQFFPVEEATERDMGLIDRMTATKTLPRRMLLSVADCKRMRMWFESVPKAVRDRSDFTYLDQLNLFIRQQEEK